MPHVGASRVLDLIIRISFCVLPFIATSYVSAADPAFAGVELSIPDETVPPGGMLQLKMQITEPKPISKGGQRTAFSSTIFGPVQGIALFSAKGDASGTAVLSNGAAQFSVNSPLFTVGTNVDYPIATIAMPVKTTAPVGVSANLILDPSLSQWVDPTGQSYLVLLKNGILTVGGTLSISNVVPGGGVVPAGTKIAIMGIGFQPDAVVQVDNATVAKKTYISSHEIDVRLSAAVNMTSRRIRVINKTTNERATYYSYQRTVPMGKSTHPLIAATVPLFARTAWTLAYFRPVLNVSQFSGVALENLTTQPVEVVLQLFASNKTQLKKVSISLQPNRRFVRDLAELFIGVVPATGTSLKVTANAPIGMLGLLGDDVLKTVNPVVPSPKP